MIAAIHPIAIRFLAGELDPDWTHAVLIGGAILAEFAVAAGIILEAPKEKGIREWMGLVLVLGGVVVSAVFTILLFVFDEGISRTQQSDIGQLRLHAAQLEQSNLALEQEIQPRDLNDKEISDIVAALAPFKGQSVRVQSYVGDTEGHRLLYALAHALGAAGLKVDVGYWMPDLSPQMLFLLGVEVDAPAADSALATALRDALAKTRIGTRHEWYPVTWADEVTVHIGVKPFPVPWLNEPPVKIAP